MGISESKKKLLCTFKDNRCEQCCKEYDIAKLHIHRINRGWEGGSYEDFRNLKVLCKKCHSLYHGNEFANCKSK